MEKRELILMLAVILIIINLINAITIITITGRAIASTSGTMSVCYNHAPAILTIANQSVDHDTEFILSINASDEDNNSIYYYDNTTLFEVNLTTGRINFTPNINQIKNYTIKIDVNDYDSGCPNNISTTFFLQIINLPPNLTSFVPNQTWEEDVWLTGLNLSMYYSDPENDNLTYVLTSGSHITISISNTSIVTFKPERDWFGVSWVVFTANDSLLWTQSNNVTLNVTHVANYCGDGICNADESCSNCEADCGTCPATTTPTTVVSGGGGSGSGGSYVIKVIEAPKEKAVCTPQEKCSDWLPQSCVEPDTQKKSCLVVHSDCGVTEEINERTCVCLPQWECTIWLPEECPGKGVQERTCLDINNCRKTPHVALQKECLFVSKPKEGELALVGGAFWQQWGKFTQTFSKYSILMVIFILILLILLFYTYSHLNQKRKFLPPKSILLLSRTQLNIDDNTVSINTNVEIIKNKFNIVEEISSSVDKDFTYSQTIDDDKL